MVKTKNNRISVKNAPFVIGVGWYLKGNEINIKNKNLKYIIIPFKNYCSSKIRKYRNEDIKDWMVRDVFDWK